MIKHNKKSTTIKKKERIEYKLDRPQLVIQKQDMKCTRKRL
jgi:hypothetical protein